MSGFSNVVNDLNNATAMNRPGLPDRNVGGAMGKDDFLLLLSAQLRHQDPLEPQGDADFAAQLAQFTSLEQMQNMNTSLTSMAAMQSYSLVGKFVIADVVIDGEGREIVGEVDSIFTRDGVTFAQIGEHAIPLSSIRAVFNTSNLLTSESLIQTSNNLIGREILAVIGEKEITGIVERIVVDQGTMYAQLNVGEGEDPVFVPVSNIVDIRKPGTNIPDGTTGSNSSVGSGNNNNTTSTTTPPPTGNNPSNSGNNNNNT